MFNSMILYQGDDSEGPRHGGMRGYRNFTLYVNGVSVEKFRDDDPCHNYNSGKYLDEYILGYVEPFERALGRKLAHAVKKDRFLSRHL